MASARPTAPAFMPHSTLAMASILRKMRTIKIRYRIDITYDGKTFTYHAPRKTRSMSAAVFSAARQHEFWMCNLRLPAGHPNHANSYERYRSEANAYASGATFVVTRNS